MPLTTLYLDGLLEGYFPEATNMHAYQWFFLGIMVAYTPSLVIVAFVLRE
jgi:hypothetical protein